MKLTPENHKKLAGFLIEYCNSLTRIEGEKDHCKAIALKAKIELDLESADFVKLAVACYKDAISAECAALQNRIDLFEYIRDEGMEKSQ